MSKFVIVDKVPEKIEPKCIVIDAPNFIPEIRLSNRIKPKNNETTVNYLRDILANISKKYSSDDFSILTSVNISNHIGLPCETDEATNKIIVDIFTKYNPKMIDKYVESALQNKPFGTKLIYFLGNLYQTTMFSKFGIDMLSIKEVPEYLGLKEKKSKANE